MEVVNSNRSSRRAFLSAAGMASAAAAAEQQIKPGVTARSASRVVGANDRVRVGMIGLGGMGTVHLQAFMKQADDEKDIQVAAVSDIFTKRKNRARDIAKLTDKDVHHDYRDLLARNDVDAVLIAAPDHWHGQMALDALAAGKDVYLEKPMTHTLEEARAIVEAVKKYGRVLQVGNQGLSACRPPTSSRRSSTRARSGRSCARRRPPRAIRCSASGTIGSSPRARPRPSTGRAGSGPRRNGRSAPTATSASANTGTTRAASRPTCSSTPSARSSTRWARSSRPASARHGGIYVHKDREVPDTYSTTIEYPNFYIEMSGSMANAGMGTYHRQAIYGHKGTLVVEGGRVMLYRETFPELRQQGRPEPKAFELPPEGPQRDARTPHTTNFFSCVRSRKQPNAPAEIGYQIISAIKLGVYAYREGRTKLFDPATRRIVDKSPARPSYEGDGQEPHSSANSSSAIRSQQNSGDLADCRRLIADGYLLYNQANSLGGEVRRYASAVVLAVSAYAADPSYFREIRPILQRQCQGCHQPNLKSSNLDLTTYEGLAAGGKRGPAVALIVKYLTGEIEAADAAGPAAAARRTAGAGPRLGGRRREERHSGRSPRNRFARQAGGLHPAAGGHRAGVFARRQDARRLGQSRNSAPHARWQRAAAPPVRALGAHPLARLLQGRIAAGGRRRHPRALRRDSVVGRGSGQTAPLRWC